jgi:UDP-N-acetylglucosamine pyrophosphorylase
MTTATNRSPDFEVFRQKMRRANVSDATIRAFKYNFDKLVAGGTGFIPEATIQPVEKVPYLEQIRGDCVPDPALLSQTLLMKLNGGLGTGMGLDQAKSLLPVRSGLTFLDFTVKQVQQLRADHGVALRFLLMNSFSTSRDSLEFLRKYSDLGDPLSLELMQSQIPKIDAATLGPISWAANPLLEWCPPGHGDLYPSLLGSGLLRRLLDDGLRYLFVSNSDNLGASLDLHLLSYFAESNLDFVMEVAERTLSDRKGGHLARFGDKFLLRESAQCLAEDQAAFQDIRRHRFFNTNNLWIRLDSIQAALAANEGFIPLPMIKNSKTVDPRDKNSPQVVQLETAMGAAIECFPRSGAIVVPRSRFAPVKTTSDLLALRSDAYKVTRDWRIVLADGGSKPPPVVDLDPEHYKLVDQLEEKLKDGIPSLKNCSELNIRGPVLLSSTNIFRGKVSVSNRESTPKSLPPGEYSDRAIDL